MDVWICLQWNVVNEVAADDVGPGKVGTPKKVNDNNKITARMNWTSQTHEVFTVDFSLKHKLLLK